MPQHEKGNPVRMGDRLWEKFSGVGNSLLHQPVETQASALINIHAPMSVLLQSPTYCETLLMLLEGHHVSVGLCCAVETASLAIFLVCFRHYYYYQNGGGNDSTKLQDTLAENTTYSSTMYYFFFFNANIHTTQQGNQCCNNVDRRCACYWNQFPCCRINSIQCFSKKKGF